MHIKVVPTDVAFQFSDASIPLSTATTSIHAPMTSAIVRRAATTSPSQGATTIHALPIHAMTTTCALLVLSHTSPLPPPLFSLYLLPPLLLVPRDPF